VLEHDGQVSMQRRHARPGRSTTKPTCAPRGARRRWPHCGPTPSSSPRPLHATPNGPSYSGRRRRRLPVRAARRWSWPSRQALV